MEVLSVLGGLIVLAVLAPRFGQDTRERFVSKEEQFAHRGFAWVSADQRVDAARPAGLSGQGTALARAKAWLASIAGAQRPQGNEMSA